MPTIPQLYRQINFKAVTLLQSFCVNHPQYPSTKGTDSGIQTDLYTKKLRHFWSHSMSLPEI